MTATFTRGCGVAFAMSLLAPAAYADLSAQEVWADWRDYMESAGYDVSGDESASDGTLTVNDVTMSMEMPDAPGRVAFSMSSVQFTEDGDGGVKITLPDTIPMQLAGQNEEGEDFTATVDYVLTAGSMTASGTPENTRYVFRATNVAMDLASATLEGEPLPPEMVRMNLKLDNVTSVTEMKQGDMRGYSQSMEADKLAYDVFFDDPDSAEDGAIKGELRGLQFSGDGMIPDTMDSENLNAMLAQGFAFDGTFTYLSGSTSITAQSEESRLNMQSSSRGGEVAMAVSGDNLRYDISQKGTTLNIASNDLPVPVTLDMENASFRLDIPVAKSDEVQDFAMSMKLSDFSMSEIVWALFDEGGKLPRDPASIALDISGKAKVLFDYMNPKVAEKLEESDQPPGELHALKINDLLVSMFGATLTGGGAFTFDNSDTETFDGMPRPEGEADLKLVGANALLDTLIESEIISKDDAMGARMMLGMFAVPGPDEDTLTSTIRIDDKGQVMANGQRLR